MLLRGGRREAVSDLCEVGDRHHLQKRLGRHPRVRDLLERPLGHDPDEPPTLVNHGSATHPTGTTEADLDELLVATIVRGQGLHRSDQDVQGRLPQRDGREAQGGDLFAGEGQGRPDREEDFRQGYVVRHGERCNVGGWVARR
jgi:hypothetical protein